MQKYMDTIAIATIPSPMHIPMNLHLVGILEISILSGNPGNTSSTKVMVQERIHAETAWMAVDPAAGTECRV